jgi:hypothetical protein
VGVHAVLACAQLRADVVGAGRNGLATARRGNQRAEICLGLRGLGPDAEIRRQNEDHRAIGDVDRLGEVECLCLDAAKRLGHGRDDGREVVGVALGERFGGTNPPEVEERPAAEAVAEDK